MQWDGSAGGEWSHFSSARKASLTTTPQHTENFIYTPVSIKSALARKLQPSLTAVSERTLNYRLETARRHTDIQLLFWKFSDESSVLWRNDGAFMSTTMMLCAPLLTLTKMYYGSTIVTMFLLLLPQFSKGLTTILHHDIFSKTTVIQMVKTS